MINLRNKKEKALFQSFLQGSSVTFFYKGQIWHVWNGEAYIVEKISKENKVIENIESAKEIRELAKKQNICCLNFYVDRNRIWER